MVKRVNTKYNTIVINEWGFKQKVPFVFVHLIVHSVSLFGEMSSEEPLHLALQSVMIAKNGKKQYLCMIIRQL